MKTTRKLLACLLVVVMLASMFCVGASAASFPIVNGDGTYTAYKVLDLEKSDATNAFQYLITNDPADTTEWYDFITTEASATAFFKTTLKSGNTYYVEAATGADSAKALLFAKDAFDYAVANGFTPAGTGTTSIELEDGFYVMKSSGSTTVYAFSVIRGELAGIDGHYASNKITSKAELPQISKIVDDANVSMGDPVKFTITVTAQTGALEYVVHDTMQAGLTLTGGITVKYNGTALDAAKYTLTTSPGDGCTFDVEFEQNFLDTLVDNDEIVIEYNATLNAAAVIGPTGNTNTATLEHAGETKTSSVSVYTGQFNVQKTDNSSTQLDGAKFKLYDAATGGNEIEVVKVSNGVYRKAIGSEVGVEIEAGLSTVSGLADGTYYLEETASPAGYQKATGRTPVSVDYDGAVATAIVVNTPGSALPETGGIGTTVFYAVGGCLVLAALVILLTKKRTTAE